MQKSSICLLIQKQLEPFQTYLSTCSLRQTCKNLNNKPEKNAINILYNLINQAYNLLLGSRSQRVGNQNCSKTTTVIWLHAPS